MGHSTALHSHAHVFEVCYRAISRAILPIAPRLRDKNTGRFVSRIKSTTERLRSEQAALHNLPLEEAIEMTRRAAQ
jgi:hypothetical protein